MGTTKADPRAERLSADAGPGREWVDVGEVDDELFDLRVWMALLFSFYPAGPRDPDSPFFCCTGDKVRPWLYRDALASFRRFMTGHVDDPSAIGLHGIRSEAFVTCSMAVGEEAAVIQGGWRGMVTASRYDRLSPEIVGTMAARMVQFHDPSATEPAEGTGVDIDADGRPSGADGLGIAARRAAARRRSPAPGPAAAPVAAVPRSSANPSTYQPAHLPAGWRRVWHPTEGRSKGYADFVGPDGRRARSIMEAIRLASGATPAPRARRGSTDTSASVAVAPSVISVDNLVDHVTFYDRPPARRAPAARVPS